MDESPVRARWVVAIVVAVLFTVLGTPRVAYAHNALIETNPAQGSTVAMPPAEVVLTFNEPAIATGTKVLVTGPDGSATAGDPTLVDTTVRQTLKAALPAGTYTVEWRVISADGHPVNGTFTFRARAGAKIQTNTSPPPAVTTPATSPSASPAATQAPEPAAGGGRGWLWLLAVIPIALAAILGWRFSRRR